MIKYGNIPCNCIGMWKSYPLKMMACSSQVGSSQCSLAHSLTTIPFSLIMNGVLNYCSLKERTVHFELLTWILFHPKVSHTAPYSGVNGLTSTIFPDCSTTKASFLTTGILAWLSSSVLDSLHVYCPSISLPTTIETTILWYR